VLRSLIAVTVIVGACLTWQHVCGPSPVQHLEAALDRFEQIESVRLSAAQGDAVQVTVTLDVIEMRNDDVYPLRAVLHLKRDGREYDRPCFLYNCQTHEWELEPETEPGSTTAGPRQHVHE
jgi:hypothetical protein